MIWTLINLVLRPHNSVLGQTLAGRVVVAGWDAALSPAMQEQRIAVAEEALAAVLVPDLDSRLGQPDYP